MKEHSQQYQNQLSDKKQIELMNLSGNNQIDLDFQDIQIPTPLPVGLTQVI